MPRKRYDPEHSTRPVNSQLANILAEELRQNRESGQPVIDERVFPSGRIRINVIWDAWANLKLEDRTAIILEAYRLVEGAEYRNRIALASDLTIPEAHAAGMLPFQIIAALRKGDSVTSEQCTQAMIQEGASTMLHPNKPILRFATEQEAEAACKRLTQRLPGSEPVWVITQDTVYADQP